MPITRTPSFPIAASAFAIIVGCWVLAGWDFDQPVLQLLMFSQAKMKAGAALAFVFAGISLWLLQTESPGKTSRAVARACAILVLLIGALTLGEYIGGRDFGIDDLLYQGSGKLSALVVTHHRITQPNAINLILIAVSLLLLTKESFRPEWLAQTPAIAALVTPSLAIVGYMHNMPVDYTVGSDVEMASLTAVTVIVVVLGIILTRPRSGLLKLVSLIKVSLVPQLIALVVSAALLAGGLVSIVMARQSQAALRKQIIANNLAAADITAELAWRYMEGAELSIWFFSRNAHLLKSVLSGNFARAIPDLQTFLNTNTRLSTCSLFDARGIRMATGSIGPSFPAEPVNNREWFQQAVATGKPYLGLPIVLPRSKQPIIPYSVPISDDYGKVRGVLLGGISITALNDAVKKLRSGPGVQVSITDSRQGGILLTHPDAERILQPLAENNHASVPLSGRERGVMETTDSKGRSILAAYTPAPHLPWGVLILQPSQTAFAPVRASLNNTQFWTSILLIITASIAGWLALRVTRPLVYLREAAAALAQGRRSAPMNLTRQDELGDLGRAFDHMAEALARRTSELEAANDDLNEQNRRVQQADRLKSEFLANMSHELRTPMNAIIGFAEIMHDGKVGPVSAQHREYLDDILTSARHLLQIINDILDLSKVEAGKMEFRPERINLAAAMEESRAVVRALADQKRIHLGIEIEPSLSEIETDLRSLKQILYNYLSNAIKFTSHGGEVTVRVKSEDADHYRIEVEDSGIGIKAEDRERLFIEFQQLDGSAGKKYSGTGLGLALTKKIVEAQGGRVGVNSTPGVGSVFFVVLPQTPRTTHEIVEETKSAVAAMMH